MAVIDARIPSASADVVAILDTNTGNQVFENARPIKVTVSESAKLMAHPVEDGSDVVDHRIILPIGISLQMILRSDQYRETYQEIRRLFLQSVNLTIQTRTDTYPNMYLQDIPHEEDPALFDTITMIVSLIETQIAVVQVLQLPPAAVRNPADVSTTDRGQQTTTDTGEQGVSVLRGFFQ